MDVNMPGMDGLEATQAIRRLEGGCEATPVIAMTADVMPHQIARYTAAGMDGFVPKPFARRPDSLLQQNRPADGLRRPAPSSRSPASPLPGAGPISQIDPSQTLEKVAPLPGLRHNEAYLPGSPRMFTAFTLRPSHDGTRSPRKERMAGAFHAATSNSIRWDPSHIEARSIAACKSRRPTPSLRRCAATHMPKLAEWRVSGLLPARKVQKTHHLVAVHSQ